MGTNVNVGDAFTGTAFTIAEENLLLLGLQVQNLMTQTSNRSRPLQDIF